MMALPPVCDAVTDFTPGSFSRLLQMVFSHPVQVIPSIARSIVAVWAGASTAFWLLPPPHDTDKSMNDRRVHTVSFDLVIVFSVRLTYCLIRLHKYIKYYPNLKN
jgi:hypothetical protein